ncbi:MAG: GTP-binding protein, partial [Cyanobacteria bacterium P01_H01_bin.121]
LLNALLGQPIFATGPTHGVTQTISKSQWQPDTQLQHSALGDVVTLTGLGESRVELIDTPGIDDVDGEAQERLARQVARQADLILFVISGDITDVEYRALTLLRQASKPMLLVFNKVDQYPDADRQAIYAKLRDERVRSLLSPAEIVMTAAAPLVAEAVQSEAGQIQIERRVGAPQIEDLQTKILEILDHEGKALVALNTMLYADRANTKIVNCKRQIRERQANELIWKAASTKALAVSINPITVVDMLSGAVIDVFTITALSRLYGFPMTEAGAVQLLKTIALSMGGITLSELLMTVGLGSLKSLLGVAAPLTGGTTLIPYVSIAATQAAIAGVSSYYIGHIAKRYLTQGATWGPDGPKAVVQQILTSLDEASILNRLRADVEQRISARRA